MAFWLERRTEVGGQGWLGSLSLRGAEFVFRGPLSWIRRFSGCLLLGPIGWLVDSGAATEAAMLVVVETTTSFREGKWVEIERRDSGEGLIRRMAL